MADLAGCSRAETRAEDGRAKCYVLSSRKSGPVMGQSITPGKSIDELSDELTDRWASLFLQKDWSERLELLQEIHDQLKEDLGDMELYAAISPVLVQKLIDRLPPSPITSVAQAQIYANSADEQHRRLAGQWLRDRRSSGSNTVR